MVRVYGHRANNRHVFRRYLLVEELAGVEVDIASSGQNIVVRHGPSPITRPSLPGKVMAWIDYKFFYRDPPLRVLEIRFEEILDMCKKKGLSLIVDLKDLDTAIKLLEEDYEFPADTIFTSRDHFAVKYLGEVSSYTVFVSLDSLPVNILDVISSANASGISINYVYLEEWLVGALHSNDYRVFTWVVNDPATALKLASMGVDGILSDAPDKVLNALSKS
ncbi:MAG: glycerophosphodiester phosphodiesterase [Thermoprotei archaeon]